MNSVAHYVQDGALRVVPTGEPVPGPAGDGTYGLTSAAVKIDARTGELSFLAGVRTRRGGQRLLAGPVRRRAGAGARRRRP